MYIKGVLIKLRRRGGHSANHNGAIIGGILGGLLLVISILICILYHKLVRKKTRQQRVVGTEEPTKEWHLTTSWSTAISVESPPPAYYSTKRWTQDSSISKPGSLVKQYSPQLAYSPSHHSMLQMDPDGGVSPSHTLVDNSVWLHTKEDVPTEQRRSIQPYQAQLNTSPSFSDALEPPGPYQTGIILHTPPPPPP
ncbi:hypothetical protein BC941DRAFT_447792 [Chlamydoabsidia padenii]|nr:hypothetical protein BC941DRAFT_447792 [Chlamydoabsidia padenii]